MAKTPINTTHQVSRNPLGFLLDAMGRGTSGAIEAQESQGQRSFVQSETLPSKFMDAGDKERLERLGFRFLGPVEGDDQFQLVEMPAGWKKQATDHSMHSNLLDDKGRRRAGIFYKAAFYDRSAHLYPLNRRYVVQKHYAGGVATAAEVRDGETILHSIPFPPALSESADREARLARYKEEDALVEQATTWLKEKFPEHENPMTYWD